MSRFSTPLNDSIGPPRPSPRLWRVLGQPAGFWILMVVAVFLHTPGCAQSGSGGQPSEDVVDTGAEDAQVADTGPPVDGSNPDVGPEPMPPDASLPDGGGQPAPHQPGGFCSPCSLPGAHGSCEPPMECVPSWGEGEDGFCSTPCRDELSCPEGSRCGHVPGGGEFCIPIAGCSDGCLTQGQECPWGEVCDPLEGACRPAEDLLCRACSSARECGGGETENTPTACRLIPRTGERFCSTRCSRFLACPSGYRCSFPSEGDEGWCYPLQGSCTESCSNIECEGDSFCQPASGDLCLDADQALCAGPCIHDTECGGSRDLCVSLPGQLPFCSRECDTCRNDLDCPLAQECRPDGTCPSLQRCQNGTCRLRCISGSCYGCQHDDQCPDGSYCANFRCHTCPPGFQCSRIPDAANSRSLNGCIPSTARCTHYLLGVPCQASPDSTCGGRYPVCAPAGTTGTPVCTRTCRVPSDCPPGWRDCRALGPGQGDPGHLLCHREPPAGWDRCGTGTLHREPGAVGSTCDSNLQCPDGLCHTVVLDGQVRGFCTLPCTSDGECPPDSLCLAVSGSPSAGLCLPRECACLERPKAGQRNLFQEMAFSTPCAWGFSRTDLNSIPEEIRDNPFLLNHFHLQHKYPLLASHEALWRAEAALGSGNTPRREREHDDPADGSSDQAAEGSSSGSGLISDILVIAAADLDIPDLYQEYEESMMTPEDDLLLADAPFEPGDVPLDQAHQMLSDGLAALFVAGGSPPPASSLLDAEVSSLPGPVASAAGLMLKAIVQAAQLRDLALNLDNPAALSPADWILLHDLHHRLGPSLFPIGAERDGLLNEDRTIEFLLHHYRPREMARAALVLTRTIERINWEPLREREGFFLNIHTPLGRVIIADSQDHHHSPTVDPDYEGPIAFLLDTGGDDRYEIPVGATTSPFNPISVAVDLAGNDVYTYPEGDAPPYAPGLLPADSWGRTPTDGLPSSASRSSSRTLRQGAGLMGVGILVDMGGGDDTYQSLRMSQGFGLLGVGILHDDGGDDTYLAESASQGSAALGMGLLVDGGGEDTYRAWHACQGYGGPRGYGLLLDQGDDNDHYIAVPGDHEPGGEGSIPVLYPWAENPRYNVSLCQGVGQGIGPHAIQAIGPGAAPAGGRAMAGGIGMLVDGGGDDRYRAGLWSQGAALWAGRGILVDIAGDDHYDAPGYAHGSAAHYGVAILIDAAGNDNFNVNVDTLHRHSLAAATEFSVAALWNLEGNDRYVGNTRSAGFAAANSIALLADVRGDDRYEMGGPLTLGAALAHQEDAQRRQILTRGLFVDAEGSDRYFRADPGAPPVGDNTVWEQNYTGYHHGERGKGLDGDGAVSPPRLFRHR